MTLLGDRWSGRTLIEDRVPGGGTAAVRIPSGPVHVDDQTVDDEVTAPSGGVGDSGTGSRHGGTPANREAFTETQWVTVRGDLPTHPS